MIVGKKVIKVLSDSDSFNVGFGKNDSVSIQLVQPDVSSNPFRIVATVSDVSGAISSEVCLEDLIVAVKKAITKSIRDAKSGKGKSK